MNINMRNIANKAIWYIKKDTTKLLEKALTASIMKTLMEAATIKGMSVSTIAKQCGVSKSYISQLTKGTRSLNMSMLIKLILVLNVEYLDITCNIPETLTEVQDIKEFIKKGGKINYRNDREKTLASEFIRKKTERSKRNTNRL